MSWQSVIYHVDVLVTDLTINLNGILGSESIGGILLQLDGRENDGS